ncbi:hypothetical protein B0H67DRAFT_166802 [Lasiosphaeris hirsuta]|uniref:Secreted protein n=1 Tax=Lasiosphaeris hirsuta TaxID=260670 RepID=A0AA40DZZ4_9PEZI|nr:hypothetical protein B0H67DRAFT_166802 [Lasiosphaeris hirsuta]
MEPLLQEVSFSILLLWCLVLLLLLCPGLSLPSSHAPVVSRGGISGCQMNMISKFTSWTELRADYFCDGQKRLAQVCAMLLCCFMLIATPTGQRSSALCNAREALGGFSHHHAKFISVKSSSILRRAYAPANTAPTDSDLATARHTESLVLSCFGLRCGCVTLCVEGGVRTNFGASPCRVRELAIPHAGEWGRPRRENGSIAQMARAMRGLAGLSAVIRGCCFGSCLVFFCPRRRNPVRLPL